MAKKKFTDEWKKKLNENIANRNIRTDSDVEYFCDKNNLPYGAVFSYIQEQSIPEECKGCKYSGTYPQGMCVSCRRGKSDNYSFE